jgi:hypothetical protein
VLETKLQETQDALAAESIRRDEQLFTTLLSGRAGVGGVYDLWRRLAATWRRRSFAREHRATLVGRIANPSHQQPSRTEL